MPRIVFIEPARRINKFINVSIKFASMRLINVIFEESKS